MNLKTKITAVASVYVLVVLLNVFAILQGVVWLKPLVVFTVFLGYISLVKEIKWYYLISLLFIFGGDIFYLFETQYFFWAMLLYAINHFFLTFEIVKFTRNVKLKNWLAYFSILGLVLYVLYTFVLKEQKGSDASVLLYGVTTCVLSALAITNYVKNTTLPNLYLMSGLALGVSSGIIISLNAFNLSSNVALNILGTVLLAVTHLIILISFLLRDEAFIELKNKED